MVKDYVVQSGPLRGFDAIFDNRFDKLVVGEAEATSTPKLS